MAIEPLGGPCTLQGELNSKCQGNQIKVATMTDGEMTKIVRG